MQFVRRPGVHEIEYREEPAGSRQLVPDIVCDGNMLSCAPEFKIGLMNDIIM